MKSSTGTSPMNTASVGEAWWAEKPWNPCSTPYTTTVSEKNPSVKKRRNAPAFGIHLPYRSDAIATPIEIQMNVSLKR